jgi:hypothetical protein
MIKPKQVDDGVFPFIQLLISYSLFVSIWRTSVSLQFQSYMCFRILIVFILKIPTLECTSSYHVIFNSSHISIGFSAILLFGSPIYKKKITYLCRFQWHNNSRQLDFSSFIGKLTSHGLIY